MKKTTLTILILMLVNMTSAFSYELNYKNGYPQKWTKPIVLYLDPANFPYGSPQRSAFIRAVSFWKHFSSAKISIEVKTLASHDRPQRGNGRSEVWFGRMVENNEQTPGRRRAETYRVSNYFGEIQEADVIFNSEKTGWDWVYGINESSSTYGLAGLVPFVAIAVHEIGHVLGLAHTFDRYSMMGDPEDHASNNAGIVLYAPGVDASAGAVRLYGYKNSWLDLGISHFKYTGSNPSGSEHEVTGIFNWSGQRIWSLKPSDNVRLELTYENNSQWIIPYVYVDYYISNNKYISKNDRWIGRGRVNLGSRSSFTTNNTYLTIPVDLDSGQTYYLGAIIDPLDWYDEENEFNNATYSPTPIWVE